MRASHRVRVAVNWANLSTPAGLLLARVGAGPVRRASRGVWIAHGYRLGIPPAPAFTVGSVILLRAPLPGPGGDPVGRIPAELRAHEERHISQYAWCGGVLMPVAYAGAAGWSWLRTGDFFSRNAFERGAGLASGGYREAPTRWPAARGRRGQGSGVMAGQPAPR